MFTFLCVAQQSVAELDKVGGPARSSRSTESELGVGGPQPLRGGVVVVEEALKSQVSLDNQAGIAGEARLDVIVNKRCDQC